LRDKGNNLLREASGFPPSRESHMVRLQCGAAHQSRDMSCRGQRQMIGIGGKR